MEQLKKLMVRFDIKHPLRGEEFDDDENEYAK